jgi:hypothetical protein
MFCKSCGNEVDNDTKFCPYCGNDVSQASPVNNTNTTSPSGTGENKIAITLPGMQKMFSGKINANTIWGCAAGLFMFVGAFLPWVTASMSYFGTSTSTSSAGTQTDSYGVWVLIIGLLCAVLSFVTARKIRALGFLILGAIAALDILIFVINFNSSVGGLGDLSSYLDGFSISKGIGMWISLIGAIGAIILGAVELRRISNVTVNTSSTPPDNAPKVN